MIFYNRIKPHLQKFYRHQFHSAFEEIQEANYRKLINLNNLSELW